VLGKSLLDLDFGSVMGEGGGVIGSSAMTIKRALSIATALKGLLGISEFEKAVGGLESSARTDGNSFGAIAFQRSESGEYAPVIDDLDGRRVLNGQFIPRLRAAYNERVVSQVAARLRGSVHRVVEGGVVKIKVRY
jgi:hypothetical protein